MQAGVISPAAVQPPVHGSAPPLFGARGPPAAGLSGHQPARGDAGAAPAKSAGKRAPTSPPGVELLRGNDRKMLYSLFTTVVVVVAVCVIRKIAVVRGRSLWMTSRIRCHLGIFHQSQHSIKITTCIDLVWPNQRSALASSTAKNLNGQKVTLDDVTCHPGISHQS